MQSLPQPLANEDWKSWATRLVSQLTPILAPNVPTETGRLSEFKIVPSGWLPTNGTNFDAKSFPALAQVLGSTTLPNIASGHVGFTMAIKA